MAMGFLVAACSSAPEADTADGEFRDIGGIETNVEVDSAAELEAFVLSNAPKTIYLNESGGFSRVETGHQEPDTRTFERSGCDDHDLCLPGR